MSAGHRDHLRGAHHHFHHSCSILIRSCVPQGAMKAGSIFSPLALVLDPAPLLGLVSDYRLPVKAEWLQVYLTADSTASQLVRSGSANHQQRPKLRLHWHCHRHRMPEAQLNQEETARWYRGPPRAIGQCEVLLVP